MQVKSIAFAIASMAALPAMADEQTLPEMTISQTRSALVADNPSPSAQVTQAQIREMNVINVEDTLKYTPSIFIRTRYVGDRNGIIATRTSGSLQSARSLVYVDGLLLSNLLGNSFNFPPRWDIVGAEEIETTEVLYGPFSTLLPGNSAGATILMSTRTPQQFEGHARAQVFTQDFKQYGTDKSYSGHQEQGLLGGRAGNLSWSLLVNHLDSYSQPVNFATAARSTTPAAAETVVSGGVFYNDPTNNARTIFGATSLDHTVQDTAKIRLAYDFSPDTRAALTFANWRNDSFSNTDTYLRDANGHPIWSGNVNIGGLRYSLGTSLAPADSNTENTLLGLTLNSRLTADWAIELAASDYRTPTDITRAPTATVAGGLAQPGSAGGAGRITFADGTGWRTFDAKAVWKPHDGKRGHAVTLGYHYDQYHIQSVQYNATNWTNSGSTTGLRNNFAGDTRTDAVFVQDAWKFDPRWTLTLGLRHERWQAIDGQRYSSTAFNNPSGVPVNNYAYPERKDSFNSPKLSLAWQANNDWLLRASVARAYRLPTVSELFQTETRGASSYVSDPDLRPEKVLATDLTAERGLANGSLRFSVFDERIDDALFSQTDSSVTPNVTSVQNVGRTRVTGAEAVYEANDVLVNGLDISGSLTYADSEIVSNPGFPSSVGKKVPRVPDWRASLFATYRFDAHWTGSLGARYSGLQFGNLDNSDTHHDDTGSLSSYTVLDARIGYRFNKLLRASLGVDNLSNAKYFIGPHPFPQRTWHGELRIDF